MNNIENEILVLLETQKTKLEAIYTSVEKTRKYFQIVLYVTLATVLLPLLGLVIGIPLFMNSYMSQFEGLL